jgi:asparagine synthase (glutamine-hydrolysing)
MDGINTYVVSEAAKRSGFTVALSGLGGDEFFGGYDTFMRTGRLRKLQQLARRSPGAAELAGRALRASRKAPAGKLGLYLQSGDFWEHPYFLQRTVFFPRQIERLCGDGPRSAEADRMAETRRECVLQEAGELDPLNQISLLEARTYMANVLLRDSDQMSMAHSLELRVPLVDSLLAAYLLSIPGEKKGFGRERKLWLRESFGALLPAEVFDRKKMGFTLPFAVWLKGPLAKEVEGTLARDAGSTLNTAAAQRVWYDFHEGRTGWSRPWALYVLSRWAAEHIYS